MYIFIKFMSTKQTIKIYTKITITQDSAHVVDRMKTGFQIPGNREFEDYTDVNHTKQQEAHNQQNSQKGRKKGLFGLFGRGEKVRGF